MRPSRVTAGYRGRILLSLAVLDAVYAWGIYLSSRHEVPPGSFVYIDKYVPLSVLATVWAGIAALCVINAFRVNDRAGWAGAIMIKIFWGAMSSIGWLTGDVRYGYLSAAIWWAFASIVWTASRWPDPKKPGGV